jgi:hypothetical protein
LSIDIDRVVQSGQPLVSFAGKADVADHKFGTQLRWRLQHVVTLIVAQDPRDVAVQLATDIQNA